MFCALLLATRADLWSRANLAIYGELVLGIPPAYD